MKHDYALIFLSIICLSPGLTDAADTCVLGRDQLCFPTEFRVGLPRGSPDYWDAKDITALGRPFRKGTEFLPYVTSTSFGSTEMRLDGKRSLVEWDSIGHFIDKIETADDVWAILPFLHRNMTREDWLSAEQVAAVLKAVNARGSELGIKVVDGAFEPELVRKGIFSEDGRWFAVFVIIEKSCVVEYKYAINAKNQIAMVQRYLVDGHRVRKWAAPFLHRSRLETDGKPVSPKARAAIRKVYESKDLPEDTPREKEIAKCNRFLKEAARNAKAPAK